MIFLHTWGDISTSVTHSHEILLWEKFQDKEQELFCVAWGLIIFLDEPPGPLFMKQPMQIPVEELFGPASFCFTGSPLKWESTGKLSDKETTEGYEYIRIYIYIYLYVMLQPSAISSQPELWCCRWLIPGVLSPGWKAMMEELLMLKSNVKKYCNFQNQEQLHRGRTGSFILSGTVLVIHRCDKAEKGEG